MKKKLLLLYVLILSITSVNAQIIFKNEQNNVDFKLTPDTTDWEEFKVNNPFKVAKTVAYKWKVIANDAPKEWEFYVCDSGGLCYLPGVSQTEKIVQLKGGQDGDISITLIPNNVHAEASYQIQMLDKDNNILGETKTTANMPTSPLDYDPHNPPYVQAEGLSNVIHWTVLNEENVAVYEILRSYDGQKDWIKVAEEKDILNIAARHSYEVVDASSVGSCYYRIKSTDYDGSIQYSSLLYLKREDAKVEGFQIAPNPVQSSANVLLQEGAISDVVVSIYSISGNLLYTKEYKDLNTTRISVPTENLSQGIYIMNVLQNGKNTIKRFAKK